MCPPHIVIENIQRSTTVLNVRTDALLSSRLGFAGALSTGAGSASVFVSAVAGAGSALSSVSVMFLIQFISYQHGPKLRNLARLLTAEQIAVSPAHKGRRRMTLR